MAEYLVELTGTIESGGNSAYPLGTVTSATFDINTLSGTLNVGTFPNGNPANFLATNLSITNLFAAIGGDPVLSLPSASGRMASDCGDCTVSSPGHVLWEPLLSVNSIFGWDFLTQPNLTTNTVDPIAAMLNGYTASPGGFLVTYGVEWSNAQITDLNPGGTPVPEPGSLALFATALLAFVCYRVIRHSACCNWETRLAYR